MSYDQGVKPEELAVLEHPVTIFSPHTGSVTRQDLPAAPERAFLLHGILSKEECDYYIKTTEAAGYHSLEKVFPQGYRSNDRVMVIDSRLADALFNRIVNHLNAEDCRCNPMGPSGEGIWLPASFNAGIKFNRYKSGCRFAPHRDGPWTPDIHMQSIYTLVLYLNDSETQSVPFSGGETNFLREEEEEGTEGKKKEEDKKEEGEIARASRPHRVLCTVTPRAGSALLFKHQALHEGAQLTTGTKYILRTELIFRRTNSVLEQDALDKLADNPHMKLIAELYKTSEAALAAGDTSKFVEQYLHAIRLQQQTTAPVAAPSAGVGTLTRDVLLQVLHHVNLTDLGRVMQASRALYRLSRDSDMWRSKYQRRYPTQWKIKLDKSLAVDWFHEYKQTYMREFKELENPKWVIQFTTEWIYVGVTDSLQMHPGSMAVDPEVPCPYCPLSFREAAMVNHVLKQHPRSDPRVVCPICASQPWGDAKQLSANFQSHLQLRHTGNVKMQSLMCGGRKQYHPTVTMERKYISGAWHSGGQTLTHIQLHQAGNTPPSPARAKQGYNVIYDNAPLRIPRKAQPAVPTKAGAVEPVQPVTMQMPLSSDRMDAFFQHLVKEPFKSAKACVRVLIICPDTGILANDRRLLERVCGMGSTIGRTPFFMPESVLILRRHLLHSGVVVCIEKDTAGFVTLVLDDMPIRTVALTQELIRNPSGLAHTVHNIVRAEERACAGYKVAVSGRLIAHERELQIKALSARQQRKKSINDPKGQGKETDMPLLPALIGSALRILSPEYQIFCSVDAEWDAVEGAARTCATNTPFKINTADANPMVKFQNNFP